MLCYDAVSSVVQKIDDTVLNCVCCLALDACAVCHWYPCVNYGIEKTDVVFRLRCHGKTDGGLLVVDVVCTASRQHLTG